MSAAHHTKLASAIKEALTEDITSGASLVEITSELINGLGFIVAYEADGNPAVLAATHQIMADAIQKVGWERAAQLSRLDAEDANSAIAVKP